MGLIKAAAGAFGGTMAEIILFQAVPELLLQMVSV